MAAGKYNITIDQGSDFALQLTIKENAVAKNLTGFSVRGQIRPSTTSSTVSASFTGSIVNATSGILKIEIPNTTTVNMSAGKYVYDTEIYTSSVVQRLLQGNATVRAEITR